MNRTELASIWPPSRHVAGLAGHTPKSPMKAIREKCLDCCAGQPSEIRLCEAVSCPLWPFRSGVHPYTAARSKIPLQEQGFRESEAL